MTKPASRPKPWVAEMREAFAAARFRKAAELYDLAVAGGTKPSFDDHLLRARIYLKHDENKAVTFLIRHKADREAPEKRGLWHLYIGVGYSRMRDFARADHHFDAASGLVREPRQKASLSYYRARRMLLERRIVEARDYIDAMGVDRSQETKIEQELLSSFAFGHEERYQDEVRSLLKTLGLIGNRREEHLESWFHAVENLAALAREIPIEQAADVAKAEVDRETEWPEDFALQRFQALKAVGWTRALRGDALGCFRYLRMAERVAPSEAFKTIVQLDRAHFARFIGERNWWLDEIASAEAAAERIDWNGTNGDERIALLLLAESFAEIDAERSRFYLARFSGLDKIRSPLHLFAFDQRLDAMAAYARGIVELGSGDSAAEETLRRAYAVFDDLGYAWRAGRAALALFRASGKERWLHAAEAQLKPYTHSWLGEDLRLAREGKTFRVQLPPQQQRVFEMLSQKMTTEQIADKLGLSQHTIRNHLKAVFKAYGVNNRSALIAEAARRGEMPMPTSAPDAEMSPIGRQRRRRRKAR